MKNLAPLYGSFAGFLGGALLFFSGDISTPFPICIPSYSTTLSLSNNHNETLSKPLPVIDKSFALEVFAGKTDTTSYIIPLKKIGRLFVIEATIDGEEGNLIFDTGATNLVLNRSYFRDYVTSGTQNTAGITGDVSQTDMVTADALSIGKMKFKKIPAHLADLGHIENRRGIKVLGLFGFGLIKSYEITIDISNSRILLKPIDNSGNLLDTANQFISTYNQKILEANNVLFVKAMVGGKNLRFCFDTGAETNALNSDLQKSVLQTVSITRTVKLKGSGTNSMEVIYGLMNNFLYGDYPINNMETIITYMDNLNAAYGVQIDGVLGFDFISKGNFCINFVKNQMGVSYITQD